VKNDLISVVKFVSFVYGLCPILSSLTLTISSDTIYAISSVMLFINIVFHDYGVSDGAVYLNFIIIFLTKPYFLCICFIRLSKTLSFNAALFSAVCLTSRFNEQNSKYTFTLISISFILFILWPNYRKYLQVFSDS
jgi:phosphatidylinositol glycan class C protein